MAGSPLPGHWVRKLDRFLARRTGYEIWLWDIATLTQTDDYPNPHFGKHLPYKGPLNDADGESSGGEFLDHVVNPVNSVPWAVQWKGHLANLSTTFLTDFSHLAFDFSNTTPDTTAYCATSLSLDGSAAASRTASGCLTSGARFPTPTTAGNASYPPCAPNLVCGAACTTVARGCMMCC